MQSSLLYWLIIGCEASFWVVLVGALAVRYLLRRRTLGSILLLLLPALDLLLFTFTALDLRSGTPAGLAHGLAAAYVGFTVAFGSVLVSWADQRFAHRFAGAPAPIEPPARGWPALGYELRLWLRCLLAVAITVGLIAILIVIVGDRSPTILLSAWYGMALGCAAMWFVFGPLWTLLFSAWRREGGA